ncbi:MAG TPA: hypothetical protein VLQ89_01405 [Candidatus Binatia bacterium]|nr:hypothetical protein [Candidatus Binatia bacterium]
MFHREKALKMILLAMTGAWFFPETVYAYIDPGTGSYVFQIIIAAFVAASFMVKIYWRKIRDLLGRLFSKKER